MREFNLLEEYPVLDKPRYVTENQRTIDHRIVASKRGKDFFDGDRNFGYGGFKYDGRWKKIADKIIDKYSLNKKSKILQINCEKGFFIYDILNIIPEINVYGIETSEYAYNNSINSEVKKKIKFVDNYRELNFEDNFFDFILCIGVTYTLNLPDIIKFLNEFVRVGKKNSFINLASYENESDFWLMKNWSLLGTSILKKEEWKKILKYTNYKGDYYFTNSHSLNIKKK